MMCLDNTIRRLAVRSLLVTAMVVPTTHAAQGPTEDSFWYYEIGGAQPISAPANPSVVSVTLGGSAQLGLGTAVPSSIRSPR